MLSGGLVASGTWDGNVVLWSVDEHDIKGYLSDPAIRKKRQNHGVLPSAAHSSQVCLSNLYNSTTTSLGNSISAIFIPVKFR